MGRVEQIWLKRVRRGPMDPRRRAVAVAGRGLDGNANQGGKRQVTVISADAWRAVERELGGAVDPVLRRANLLVSGVELAGSRGRLLRVGGCRLLIHGELRPCRQMEESRGGLQAALSRDWRGGVYGEVVEGGELAVGDEVAWEPEPPAAMR